MSRSFLGVPSGLLVLNVRSPSYPTISLIRKANSFIEMSFPVPTLIIFFGSSYYFIFKNHLIKQIRSLYYLLTKAKGISFSFYCFIIQISNLLQYQSDYGFINGSKKCLTTFLTTVIVKARVQKINKK